MVIKFWKRDILENLEIFTWRKFCDTVGKAVGGEADDKIPKLTGNGWRPSEFSWHSTGFAIYVPAATVYMHQRVVYSTKHISKKVRQFTVPTWSQTYNAVHIIFFSSTCLYMKGLNDILGFYWSIILYVWLC